MLSNIKKFYFLFLLSFFYAICGTAKIPFPAFKEISSHFHTHSEHYSPTLGVPIIESGFIENIRFNIASRAFNNNDGSRDYSKDKPLVNDPISDLVIRLFPSTAGQLSTLSEHTFNFGRRLKGPETIAKLLNYIFRLEHSEDFDKNASIEEIIDTLEQTNFDEDRLKEKLKTEIDRLSKEAIEKGNSEETLKNAKNELQAFLQLTFEKELYTALEPIINRKNFLRYNTNPLKTIFSNANNCLENTLLKKVKSIKEKERNSLKKMIVDLVNLIEQEDMKQKNNQSFYPRYILPQVFSAFFVQHFNTKENIKTLLVNLDDYIVNKGSLSTFNSLDILNESDFRIILLKDRLDMDNILALLTSDIWFAFTPYRSGSPLLSNGRAHPFNRDDGTFLTDLSFADCAEMALRHICNLMFYDKNTREWDLSHIDDQNENPYFIALRNFYQSHSIDTANAGDVLTRSQWNKVVSALNSDDPNEKKIIYRHDTYEVVSNFTNLINIFAKLLGLSVGEPKGSISDQKKWVEHSLKSIFQKMNPKYSYEINCKNLDAKDSLIGTIEIKVSFGQEIIFGFNFYASGRHTEIKDFRTPTKDDDFSKKIDNSNELTQPFFLLSDSSTYKNKIVLPIFRVIGSSLQDDKKKIELLKLLPHFASNNDLLALLENLLKNLAQDVQFDDVNAFSQVLPALMDLVLDSKLSDAAFLVIKSCVKDKETATFFLEYLNKLNEDDLNKNSLLINELLKHALKNANLNNSEISHVFSLMSTLASKKNLQNTLEDAFLEITNLKLSPREKTYIQNQWIEKLLNLNKLHVTNYVFVDKTLDLRSLTNLEKIYLTQIEHLEDIKLPSKIEEINFNNIPLIETINWDELALIKTISFDKLPQLVALSFNAVSTLQKISVTNCVNIAKISLSNLPRLNYVDMGSMPSLAILSMQELPRLSVFLLADVESLPNIEGFDDLVNLRTLQINGMEKASNILEINVTKMTRLKNIYIRHNEKIKGIEFSEQNLLEEILLFDVIKLEKLDVSNLKHLNDLSIQECENLQNVDGLDSLPPSTKISINEPDDDEWLDV